MNILYLFPPQWMPVSPHFALPSLIGQFEGTEHYASAMDLNIDFYEEILTSDNLKKSLARAKELEQSLYSEITLVYEKGKEFQNYPFKYQNKIIKHGLIKKFTAENQDAHNIVFLIEEAVKIMRSKKHFYNPKLLVQALNIISKGLEIASMPYYPTILTISGYINQQFVLDYENIKYFVFDEDTNIFTDYFKKRLPEIIEKDPQYIGISINASSQIIPGLTLAYLVKKHTKAHVNIGGNFFGRVTDALMNHPEFFELFCHSVSAEEGEKPVVELAQYINGEIPIEEVSNLLYPKDGKIVMNPVTKPITLNEMKPLSLNGFNLEKYFTPEIVMPFQTSKGCYWRQCSFCDHDFGMHYNVKSLDILIEQLKMMKEKYGITKYEFIDEAIGPKYLNEMSERLIKEGIEIRFFHDARLESEFTSDILEKSFKAGNRMILWGLESGSRKIMKLINKGVSFDKRLKILKDSRNAGIFNFAFIFFGFPAETKKDAMKTIDMICANTDIINVYGKSIFTMGKHTKLRRDPEEYGVLGTPAPEAEFSPVYSYKAKGMTPEELNEMSNLCADRAFEAYGNSLVFQLISRELLFLYLDKMGVDWVCNYKFD